MSNNWFDLTGKVAVVTGSTKGIGLSMARAMAENGAKVVISSRKADLCDEIAKSFTDDGLEAIAIPCNISHLEQIENLMAKTREQWGKIDILICNAAVNPYYGSALDIPEDMLDKTMDVNIKSNLWLCQRVIPEMQERKDGVIIITSSIGGMIGNPVIGAYCITKAADMQMARNLAIEFGKDNIRVNCVAPGLVKTNFARALYEDPEVEKERSQGTPLRRLGEPDDLGGIAVYLASRAGNWTTGQTICVDGGVTVAR